MLGPAAQTLIAMLTYIGGPLMGATEYRPEETITPAVNISIADEARSVAKGQLIRYTLKVVNTSGSQAPVTIRLTLPPGVFSAVNASEATVVANAAAWRTTLAAGESRTYSLDGTIDPQATRAELAATACVHTPTGIPACDTDLNHVDTSNTMRTYSWIAAILLGLLAVVLSVWLQRNVRPEFLTPENALKAYGPGQPGGAPSA